MCNNVHRKCRFFLTLKSDGKADTKICKLDGTQYFPNKETWTEELLKDKINERGEILTAVSESLWAKGCLCSVINVAEREKVRERVREIKSDSEKMRE